MFSFRRLFVSRAATRLPAWAPLRVGFRWKSTTPTATGSQGLPALPRLDANDFAFHKEHVDKIIIRNLTVEEKEALAALLVSVGDDLKDFCKRVEHAKPATLLRMWQVAVDGHSNLEEALIDFFAVMNFKVKKNLSQEDLKDLSLLEWGRAFVEVRFKNTALLTYDELIPALRKEMLTKHYTRNYAAVSWDDSQLAGLLRNNRAADEERYEEFRELLDRTNHTSGVLHFICGDSGSGKTHFAINAAINSSSHQLDAENASSRSDTLLGESASVGKAKVPRVFPIVFYVNVRVFIYREVYKTLRSHHHKLEELRGGSDDAEKQAARDRRDDIAATILVDQMKLAMYPYQLKDKVPIEKETTLPSAFVILDEAVKAKEMLHALTSKDTSAVQRLNSKFPNLFSSVRVVAASTASREFVRLLASSRSKMQVFNMTPDRKLIEAELKRQKIELLAKLWERDTFFYMLTHNKRCAAEVSRLVEYNRRTLLALNEAAGKLFEFKEKELHSQLENSTTDTVNLEEEKLNGNARLETKNFNDPIKLLKEVTLSSVGRQEFSDIMDRVTGWLNKHAVLYYKSQNSLADRSAAQCRDIVMRGIFLCATGKPAKLHKFKEDGVATTGKHFRSTLLSKEEIEEATADDPITTGVVAVLPSGKEDHVCSVTYSIGLHHLAMAMLNYFERPPKRDSGELTASGSGTAGDKQQLQPRQPLTFSVKEAEGFFGALFTFLCQCVLEARVRGDVLSLLDVLGQFRWPSAEACAPMTAEEKEVWDALNTASEDMSSVIYDKCALPYPFAAAADPPLEKDGLENLKSRTFTELCSKLGTEESAVSVVMNGGNAQYADFIVRCGKVLLLVSVKRQCNYGVEKMTVEEDTAKLGFSFDGAGALEGYEEQLDATKSLANSLDCDCVVPVFALFTEPHGNLSTSLPTVNVSKNGVLMMKPIVLYIRPYMECRVKTADMPLDE